MPLHLGGDAVTLEELRALSVPDASKRHRPVPHHAYVPLMRRFIRDQDADVDRESFHIARGGAEALLIVTGKRSKERYRPAIVTRCSTNKRSSLQCAVGGVLGDGDCLMLRTVLADRKQTTLAWPQFVSWLEVSERQRYYHRDKHLTTTLAMRCTHVDDEVLSAVLGIALCEDAMTVRQVRAAWDMWLDPPTDETYPRTAFAAYCCCSAAIKTTHPADAIWRYVTMHELWTQHRPAFGRKLIE